MYRWFDVRFRCFVLFFCFCLAPSLFASKPRYASIVMDARSGEILHQISSQTSIYPASLTKMMTLYMVFDALRKRKLYLGKSIRVSRHAARQEPSKLGLKAGDRITVEQAILALVCRSANDAAVVLAEAVGGGSEKRFARMMTQKARTLGLRRTTFHNASGLFHPGQKTTAQDMALLGMRLIRHFPYEYRYFRRRSFHFRGRLYRTHNRLVGRVRGVDGLKTGYIRKAGFNLVSSAKRGNRRLMAVVIGGKTARWRDKHMTSLLEMGFRQRSFVPIKRRVSPTKKKTSAVRAIPASSRRLPKRPKPARRKPPTSRFKQYPVVLSDRSRFAGTQTIDDLLL